MATPPDFSVGQVLTAAHMNAVGLWLVKTQTIGSAVSSVTVTDAFSAEYDFYKITITGGAGSVDSALRLRLGATTTGYYYGIGLYRYDGVGFLGGGASNSSFIGAVGFMSASGFLCDIDVTNPFTAHKTGVKGHHWDTRTGGGTGFGFAGGHLNNTTSYTAFTILPDTGTMTGGIIRVYGYRN